MAANELDTLLLNPSTRRLAAMYLSSPHSALLITGTAGSGKYTLAKTISATLLQDSPKALENKPNFLLIQVPDGHSEISIDTIRTLRRRLALKNASSGQPRLVLLENADKMSDEAQNALLKTLEEPPADTTFILTASTSKNLLPTIVSRTWALSVQPIDLEATRNYYRNFNTGEVEKAWNLSCGVPGLLNALLQKEEGHPLRDAVDRAKLFISSSVYDRLIQADQEAANPAEFQLFLEALSKIMTTLHRQSIGIGGARGSDLLANRRLIFRLQNNSQRRANARLTGLELALTLKV